MTNVMALDRFGKIDGAATGNQCSIRVLFYSYIFILILVCRPTYIICRLPPVFVEFFFFPSCIFFIIIMCVCMCVSLSLIYTGLVWLSICRAL